MTAGGSIGVGTTTLASVRGGPSDTLWPMPPASLRHVVITGLMASGKTTVGSRLAARLGWAWRDSDVDIEAAGGLTVRKLRERDGVDAMHAREAEQLLDALAAPERSVISAAASVVEVPACRAALAGPDIVVFWLRADPALLAERFGSPDEHRPTYGPEPAAFLAEQAACREPYLGKIGALVLDIAGLTPDEVVARAIEVLG